MAHTVAEKVSADVILQLSIIDVTVHMQIAARPVQGFAMVHENAEKHSAGIIF